MALVISLKVLAYPLGARRASLRPFWDAGLILFDDTNRLSRILFTNSVCALRRQSEYYSLALADQPSLLRRAQKREKR